MLPKKLVEWEWVVEIKVKRTRIKWLPEKLEEKNLLKKRNKNPSIVNPLMQLERISKLEKLLQKINSKKLKEWNLKLKSKELINN